MLSRRHLNPSSTKTHFLTVASRPKLHEMYDSKDIFNTDESGIQNKLLPKQMYMRPFLGNLRHLGDQSISTFYRLVHVLVLERSDTYYAISSVL